MFPQPQQLVDTSVLYSCVIPEDRDDLLRFFLQSVPCLSTTLKALHECAAHEKADKCVAVLKNHKPAEDPSDVSTVAQFFALVQDIRSRKEVDLMLLYSNVIPEDQDVLLRFFLETFRCDSAAFACMLEVAELERADKCMAVLVELLPEYAADQADVTAQPSTTLDEQVRELVKNAFSKSENDPVDLSLMYNSVIPADRDDLLRFFLRTIYLPLQKIKYLHSYAQHKKADKCVVVLNEWVDRHAQAAAISKIPMADYVARQEKIQTLIDNMRKHPETVVDWDLIFTGVATGMCFFDLRQFLENLRIVDRDKLQSLLAHAKRHYEESCEEELTNFMAKQETARW